MFSKNHILPGKASSYEFLLLPSEIMSLLN